jgi:anti-sigma regulatory factor (Ser/Thr protein kinase)
VSSNETELINARLPRKPRCGATARRLLSDRLGPQVGEDVLADAQLVTSELVNNAYLHGRGRIELRVSRLGDRLRVEVIDEGKGRAVVLRRPSDRGGRGLRIVEALSLAWGAFEGTTHVWAEIGLY